MPTRPSSASSMSLGGAPSLPKSPSTPDAAANPIEAKKRRGFIGRLKTPLLMVFVAAIMGGGAFAARIYLNGAPQNRTPVELAASAAEHESAPEPAPSGTALITRVDHLIAEGNYAQALRLCAKAEPEKNGNKQELLTYRQALCQEGLKKWKEAETLYASLTESGEWTTQSIAAMVGLGRCAVSQHHADDAHAILAKLTLSSAHPAMQERPYLAEAFYLRAALEAPAARNLVPNPLAVEGIVHVSIEQSLDRFLDWAEPNSNSSKRKPEALPQDCFELLKNKRSSDQHLITANRPNIAVADALRLIAEKATVSFHMPAEVESRLSGLSVHMVVKRLPLADVLTALVEPRGVFWKIDSHRLELASNDREHPEETQTDRVRAAMQRALMGAPDHPGADALRLQLANSDYERGNQRQAMDGYHRLIEGSPHRPEALIAAYNLGLTYLGLSDFKRAKEQFHNVLDRATGRRWTAIAWWWLGRCSLDVGDWDAALTSMKKSFDCAGSSDIKATATLGISTVLSLKGELAEAHRWIRKERISLNSKPFRNSAALIDALALCRIARSEGIKCAREEENVLQALRAAENDQLIGPAGALLFGQACQEIELQVLMVPQYEKALTSLRGPLAKQLTFELAEYHLGIGQTASAKERYLAVAAADKGKWGSRSRLQLADLAMKESRPGECVGLCREVLNSDVEYRDAALLRMGKAYAKQGKNDLAAECFAGRAPGERSH